ncbi:hypothetical protein Ndes2437B_g08332 [Nannochloris sp. 'desiccata']
MQGGSIRREHGQTNRGSAATRSSRQTTPPLQAKLRQHIDREDYKIKAMAESILYTFVPSAMKAILAAAGTEEKEDVDVDGSILLTACQATDVAAAALAVATLLDAPPGFLKFLLCLPWFQFTDLYATLGDAPLSATTPTDTPRLHLATPTEDEKFRLVNCQLLDERLLDCIMDFLYINTRSNEIPVLPPLMCLFENEYVPQNGAEAGKLQKAIYVQLQGCTPLHCAAMRGNPALVDALLTAGADPLVKNGLGQVAMELVPKCCGSNKTVNSTPPPPVPPSQPSDSSCGCRCVNQNSDHQGPPECLSSVARFKLVRKSLITCTSSLWAWVHMLLLCLLCVFGFLGCPTTLLRPEVESRGEICWEERKKKAQHKAQATVLKLRTQALQGREQLRYACGKSEGRHSYETLGNRPLDDSNDIYTTNACASNDLNTTSEENFLEKGIIGHGNLPRLDKNNNNNNNDGCSTSKDNGDGRSAASKAYSHFSAAVNILKSIRVQQTNTSSSSSSPSPSPCLIPEAHFLPSATWPEVEVNEIEIAVVWAGFAESALAMMEACGCAGCLSTAGSAIHTAVTELMQFSGTAGCGCGSSPPSPSAGGGQGVTSPRGRKKNTNSSTSTTTTSSRSGTSKGRMKQPLSISTTSPQNQNQQQRSSSVAAAAADDDDLETRVEISRYLAIAVHAKGKFILKTDVQQSPSRAAIWKAQQCVTEWSRVARFGVASCTEIPSSGGGGGGTTIRTSNGPCTEDEIDDIPLEIQCLDSWAASAAADVVLVEALLGTTLPLENALKHAKKHASEHIIALAQGVVKAAGEEFAAGERLREFLQQRSSSSGTGSAVSGTLLTGPSAEQLAAAIDAASRFPSLKEEVGQVEALRERWAQRAAAQQQLDVAVESARGSAPPGVLLLDSTTNSTSSASANISSLNEQGFWKELNSRLQLVETAIEAARQSSISVARAKKTIAELHAQGSAVEAGKVLEEALNGRAGSAALKAALAKAENAATAAAPGAGAFAIGSQWLAPRVTAARTKLSLERAAETLARAVSSCRSVSDLPKLEAAILAARKFGLCRKLKIDLKSVFLEAEKAISNAEQHGALLESEVAAAREAITAVQATSAAEMKLAKALREGAGVAALSLAIKEAAAAGVQQVNEARKILKLMQSLEAAVAAATTEKGPAARQSLQAKISASAAGGVPSSMISEARNTLHKLLITDVRAELDAALKLTTTTTKVGDSRQAPAQRLATLRAVLEKVDSILSLEGHESHCTRAPARTLSCASSTEYGGGGGGGNGAATPPLMHEPTMFGARLHTQRSSVSQAASSTSSASTPRQWSTTLSVGGGTSIGGELSHLGSECSAIELRVLVMNDLAAVWFEPKDTSNKISNGEDVEDGGDHHESRVPFSASSSFSSSSSDIAHHHAESSLASYDDAIAVRRMAHQARQRLYQEELEQARFEREKFEEARLYRELQLREKSAREAVEKERAEKARAERAERLAAVEAQKAERRERERVARAERELERQAREAAAKEHFVLLQRRRKMLADQARAAHMAQLLAEQQAQHTAGLFSPPTSPAQSAAAAMLPVEMIPPSVLGSEAVSTSGVMQLLLDPDNGTNGYFKAEEVWQQQQQDGAPSPSQLPRLRSPLVFAPTTTATSLPGTSSHNTLWTSTDSHDNLLLSTKINATALPPGGQTTTSLFGDLGGASWLSTNPLTSGLPLATALTPPRLHSTNTNSTRTPSRTINGNGLTSSPSALMWGSADSTRGALASTLITDQHQHHHDQHRHNLQHHRSLGSSGYDLASGLWSSVGSDGAITAAAAGGGGGGVLNGSEINTSVLGLYPVQTTLSRHTTDGIALANGDHSAASSPAQLDAATAAATAAHYRLPSETSLFE